MGDTALNDWKCPVQMTALVVCEDGCSKLPWQVGQHNSPLLPWIVEVGKCTE